MTTLEIKTDVLQLVERIEDIQILQALKVLLIKHISYPEQTDFWDDLPQNVINDINEGLQEADQGELRSHDEVMQRIKNKYIAGK